VGCQRYRVYKGVVIGCCLVGLLTTLESERMFHCFMLLLGRGNEGIVTYRVSGAGLPPNIISTTR
jgi:hypothetical protein